MQPIQDVVPPHDPLGNPQNFAQPAGPVDNNSGSSVHRLPHNPIAGTAMAQSQTSQDNPVGDPALDGVLKAVTSNIKAPPPVPVRPVKRGLLGFLKKKPKKSLLPPLSPGSPLPQQQLPARPQPNLPPGYIPLPRNQMPPQNLPPRGPGPNQQQVHGPGQLASGPVRPKTPSKIKLPVVVAVIVAIALVLVALSAFKN